MKFLLGLFLFAGFVAGGVSASEMLKGIEIGTIASGNPTCLDWKDADSKSIFGMGYKSDEGCTTYEGPINFGDKKLPSFALSAAKGKEDSFTCDAKEQGLAQQEYVTILCFDKEGKFVDGACGSDCPYVLVSVTVDPDDIDVGGISLKASNQAVLYSWEGTAAVFATYDIPDDSDIKNNFMAKSISDYKTSGSLCGEEGCGARCDAEGNQETTVTAEKKKGPTCPGISHIDFCFACGGESYGEPHFLTWTGEYFDYMGECDLVLAESKSFADGLGLTCHARTKARYDYSYIESAALQIGKDVLEVSSFGDYMFNGMSNAELPLKMAEKYIITKVAKNDHDVLFEIKDGETEIATLKAFKDLVSVKFGAGFRPDKENVHGILGDRTGARYSRDHSHIIENVDEFGQEWQVRPGTDPELFQAKPAVQYPTKCMLKAPGVVEDARRHLGESISVEDATKACKKAGFSLKGAMDACIYDVIAIGDLEAAQSGAF